MTDTPQHIKELQLKIWLSKSPGERLRLTLEGNGQLLHFWSAARVVDNRHGEEKFKAKRTAPKKSGTPQLKKGKPSSTEFSIGYNTRNEAEVDSIMAQAKKAGAIIVKPAQKTFWGGYGGYFKDPDGHLWEIAYNPNLIPVD